ncbi:MAG TPA: hypothetical protein DGB72_02445 [Gemmatimonadetes bacterium]|nr:hypothetical protein [Gemmatimonadota bacterium]
MIPALRLEVPNAARGRHAVLADHDRHVAVMCDELPQIAEVVARALGRPSFQVSGIDQEKIGIVRVRVVGGEHAGRKRRRRTHSYCIKSNGVVVVLLGHFDDLLAPRLEHRNLLSLRGLGRVHQRIERRPVRVGNRALRVVLPHLEAHQVITLLGKPRLERIATR